MSETGVVIRVNSQSLMVNTKEHGWKMLHFPPRYVPCKTCKKTVQYEAIHAGSCEWCWLDWNLESTRKLRAERRSRNPTTVKTIRPDLRIKPKMFCSYCRAETYAHRAFNNGCLEAVCTTCDFRRVYASNQGG